MTPWRMSIIWTGTPALICISGAPARSAPSRMPLDEDAPRVGSSQQGDGDGVEADRRGIGRGQVVLHAHDLDGAGEAGQHAAGGHGQDDDHARAHAGVAGGVGIGANGPDLEADGAAVQHPPHDGHRGEGDEHARVQQVSGAAGEDRKRGGPDVGRAREGGTGSPQGPAHGPRDDLQCHEVEHDRDHHLVRTGVRLQPARDEAVRGTRRQPCHERDGDRDDGGGVGEHDGGGDGSQGAHQELALRADVEEPGLEAETDRESAQDVWRRAHQRVDEAD